MDWTKIKRTRPQADKPAGVYSNLDDLIRIQFKVRDLSLLPQQPVTSVLSGRYASRLRGRGLNFEELRRYQPGDDIRTMDWKVTARTRSPHVRVYTEEKDRAILLLVDQRINMFFGTRDRLKSVTAAELAAIGGWRALDVGDRVGALIFNDSESIEIVPQRSRQNVMQILGGIVRFNHQLSAQSEVEPNGEYPLLSAHLIETQEITVSLFDYYTPIPTNWDSFYRKVSTAHDPDSIEWISASRWTDAQWDGTISRPMA